MRPKRYQGLVVGMKTYRAALEAELERVRKLGMANRAKYYDPDTNSTKGVWFAHCDPDKNPYESRFGASWRAPLPVKFAVTSIKVLIDHMIKEGNRHFADTTFANSWFMYHDALPQ